MQVLILAGGLGTRLSEETDFIPKPMVRIGNLPILEHIMNYYSRFNHHKFLIALGYKSEIIFEYFDKNIRRDLDITLVDTGIHTSTGGRIKKLESYLDNNFMMTYGDGLSNVNLETLVDHHNRLGKLATVTAVRPPGRFGKIEFHNSIATKFSEKDSQDTGWINGGFFCLQKNICALIKDDATSFESEPINQLVRMGELAVYEHHGWWQPMDTLREKRLLEEMLKSGNAPWLT